jgi:arginase
MAASVPGFAPLSDADLVLLGVRDLDPPEAVHILNTAVRLLEPAIVSQGLAAVLEEMRRRVRSLHVHLDLDVLDPRDGRANHFAAPDGLRLGELVTILSGIARQAAVTSLTLSAYEPAADADGRALHAALESIEAFTDAWADSR